MEGETGICENQDYRTVVASPERQSNAYQFKCVDRDFVCYRAWLQMGKSSHAFRKLTTIYTHANRWDKAGLLDLISRAHQENDVISLQIDHVYWDSKIVKMYPDGAREPLNKSPLLA